MAFCAICRPPPLHAPFTSRTMTASYNLLYCPGFPRGRARTLAARSVTFTGIMGARQRDNHIVHAPWRSPRAERIMMQ